MEVTISDEESPRHRKKARKHHVKSDHKHEYEDVCIDSHSCLYRHPNKVRFYHIGQRCRVCGRLGNVTAKYELHEPPEGMPLFEVTDFWELLSMKYLPDGMEVTKG